MKTVFIVLPKNKVPDKIYQEFFEFIDPFLAEKGLHLISNNPKIYASKEVIPENVLREIKGKLRNRGSYTRVIDSVYSGRLNKL